MRRLAGIAVVFIALAAASGCVVPYYLQAVRGQIGLLRAREPIEAVIADPATDAEIRERLETVLELRRFATEELGLPENGSYRSYVRLDRDYVVWNVIAAERFSVDPEQWCFPVAGCVSYRGYFDRDKALAFERELAGRGLDTWSGGSPAYSTLGYFDDPVLSTMLTGPVSRVAGVLFHELAHARVYVKDDSELSEAFASAVEEHGVERWLLSRGEPEPLDAYREERRRAAEFAALVAGARLSLQAIYAEPADEQALLAAKAAAFETLREDYAALRATWEDGGNYDGWFASELNNARLAALSTYRQWLPALRWKLGEIGLEGLYAEVERLAGLADEERQAELGQWAAAASAAGSRADAGQRVGGGSEYAAND